MASLRRFFKIWPTWNWLPRPKFAFGNPGTSSLGQLELSSTLDTTNGVTLVLSFGIDTFRDRQGRSLANFEPQFTNRIGLPQRGGLNGCRVMDSRDVREVHGLGDSILLRIL